MKKGILFLLIITSVTANAQKLKDLLYGGKLKNDSNTVIRKTDDLSSKIDTGNKKEIGPEKQKNTTVTVDSGKKVAFASDSAVTSGIGIKDSVVITGVAIKQNTGAIKSNNKIWKEYTDSLASSLKSEVLSSKKIKKDTYYLMVDYEIGADGGVSIINVTSAPENSFLQDQVKERLLSGTPQLAPILDSTGKTHKVKRRYNFNVTKE